MLPFIVTTRHFWPPELLEQLDKQNVAAADVAIQVAPPQMLHLYDQSRRGKVDDSVSINAFVDDGIWKACCPFCPSAQVVTPSDPRFLCAGGDGCANHPVGGAYVPIVFPRNIKRIERELIKRPRLMNRNWLPEESVEVLIAENIQHGVTAIDAPGDAPPAR